MADVNLEEMPPEEGQNRAFLLGALVLGGLFVLLLCSIGLYLAVVGPARGRPAATANTPTRTPIPSPSPLPPTYTPTPSPTFIPTATPTSPVVAAAQPTATPTLAITPSPARPTPTPRPPRRSGLPQTGADHLGWGLGVIGVLLLAFLARRLRLRSQAS